MKLRLALTALALAAAFGASAQQSNNSHLVVYTPVTCIRAGELPLLQMDVRTEGELIAYFRRINTTDWCSVRGKNDGPLSRVVLPKFEDGDEIEYFMVVIQGRRVVSRSRHIYRAKVGMECQTTFARHVTDIPVSCGEEQEGPALRQRLTPASIAAGDAIPEKFVVDVPLPGSPDNPNQAAATTPP